MFLMKLYIWMYISCGQPLIESNVEGLLKRGRFDPIFTIRDTMSLSSLASIFSVSIALASLITTMMIVMNPRKYLM